MSQQNNPKQEPVLSCVNCGYIHKCSDINQKQTNPIILSKQMTPAELADYTNQKQVKPDSLTFGGEDVKQEAELNQPIERMLRFNCPNGCDGNGSFPEMGSDAEWEQAQCQWCFEFGMPAREAINSRTTKLLNEQLTRLEEKFRDSERRSGQGSRPQFSKETETLGEYRSRSKGFKSAMLVALTAIENERKKLTKL